jgi:predicted metal-dependent HD superfamily phosphohydrolase
MDEAKHSDLLHLWTRPLADFGAPAEAILSAFADLRTCYTSAGRYYHTLDHIHAMLCTVRAPGGADEMPALPLAVWFHDAIYDTRANDNEEKSAALARRALQPLGVPEAILSETERLILLTKTHSPASGDRPGQLLIDADLAVLGAPETEYDAYARAIRQEYAWVHEETYRTGRRTVLETFLRRPRIYCTEEMFVQREEMARQNLRREIETLVAVQ